MEAIVPLLFLAALAGIFFAAKRGAEAAQREREERWSQLPGLAPALGQVPARGVPRGNTSPAGNGSGPAPPPSTGSQAVTTSPSPQAPGASPSTRHGPAATATRTPQAARQPAAAAPRPAAAAATPPTGTSAAAARRRAAAPGPIDLNTAPVTELQKLPGVGVRAAERIVAHRERHGPFSSVRALEAVEGFDEHRVSRLAPRAKV